MASTGPRGMLRRLHPVKALVAVAVVAIVGWYVPDWIMHVQSEAAVTNVPVATVRPPRGGQIRGLMNGETVRRGQEVGRVTDENPDSSALIEVEARRRGVENKIASLRDGIAGVVEAESRLAAGFADWLVRQEANLKLQHLQATSVCEAGKESLPTFSRDVERQEWLFRQGLVAQQQVEQARRVALRATTETNTACLEAERVAGERRALTTGVQLRGEDLTKMRQRLEDLRLQLMRDKSELTFLEAQLVELRREEQARARLMARRSSATLTSPVDGIVWKVFVADGAEVRQGDDIVQVAECGAPLVTALFVQRHLPYLGIGRPVRVRVLGRSEWRSGRIERIAGLYEADGRVAHAVNLRAEKGAPLQVWIRLDEPLPDCLIGAQAVVRVPR